MNTLITVSEASKIATEYLNKAVSESNITYLIQYGRIDRHDRDGSIYIDKEELLRYYSSSKGRKEMEWKDKLGEDINWRLSFDEYNESQTTKHVHRLHPYKGKYIPQLVEYFLDTHTDEFKHDVYFHPGDIVLDPFCGSGTTLVQANELGIHAIGIDISSYNAQISNCKIGVYDLAKLKKSINYITDKLENLEVSLNVAAFDSELLDELYKFNTEFFPSPEFRKLVYNKQINEKEYAKAKSDQFLPTYMNLLNKYNLSIEKAGDSFLDTWYFETTRKEIHLVNDIINQGKDESIKSILQVILSRTMRSCRATTHSDLATLLEPVYTTYYCTKHKKICKPLFSILKWWKTYSTDTVKRLAQFSTLRTETTQHCFSANSANVNLQECVMSLGGGIAEEYNRNKIKGIFCSPPYVGLIDYHEQHAYAYELFGLERKDDQEIGSMQKGNTIAARQQYVDCISAVLINCKKYLADDYEVFLVANDKYGLYQTIADTAGMVIVDQFKRPVLNRTEKDKNAYSEIIFRMKEKRQ